MPRVDNLIDRLGDTKFITTLDLSRGYWYVPVRKEDQVNTAFTTPFDLATFQRMMDVILWDIGSFATAYLDDVIIHSHTWEEHLQHISMVLDCLGQAGLTVKPRKCQFAMSTCSYLGHIVGNGSVRLKLPPSTTSMSLASRSSYGHSSDSLAITADSSPTTRT